MMTIVKAWARLSSAWVMTMTAIATAIGPVGPGYLGARSPEHRREEAHGDRPVYAGKRPQARCHAEGQRYRQSHDRRRETAKQVPTEGSEIVAYADSLEPEFPCAEPYR